MEKEFVIRCRAVIVHEGKLLLVKHTHNPTVAVLPGGHLEFGEDPKECLSREIIEELGIEPIIGRLLYVNTFTVGENKQPVEFFFEVLNSSDYLALENNERTHAHEIDECVWVDKNTELKILPDKFAADFRDDCFLSDKTKYIKG